jgi:hypothetical protein
MSGHEKFAWASLVASALVWAFFAMRMTEGGQFVDAGARHMLWTYVVTVVLMAVAHSVIAAVLAARPHGIALKDERDRAIEARADRIEGYVVLVAINVLVIHALADAALAGHALPRLDLSSLPTLVFALITTLFAGHIANQAVTIWLYRA